MYVNKKYKLTRNVIIGKSVNIRDLRAWEIEKAIQDKKSDPLSDPFLMSEVQEIRHLRNWKSINSKTGYPIFEEGILRSWEKELQKEGIS